MIQFPCHCGHAFKVMDEMAGGMLQCPKCGKLNDVPTISDLAALEEDGTLKMGEEVKDPEPERIRKLLRTYARTSVDDQGEEIDLRDDALRRMKAGVEEVPPEVGARGRAGARAISPKYDPLTGEMVEELEIEEEVMSAIPVGEDVRPGRMSAAEAATLPYARRKVTAEIEPGGLELLLRPINLFVMTIVFLLHFPVMAASVFGFILPGPFLIIYGPIWVGILWLIPSYYVTIIEEIGPEGRSELPRPLRNVELWDDLFYPGVRLIVSLFLCFGPTSFVLSEGAWLGGPVQMLVSGGLYVLGCLAFPAVMLAAGTSGTYHNLRPDRLIRTAMGCPAGGYLLAAAFSGSGILLYQLTTLSTLVNPGLLANLVAAVPAAGFLVVLSNLPGVAVGGVSVGSMVLALILTHLAAVQIGLLYRVGYDKFEWVGQRHIGKNRQKIRNTEEALALARSRRQGDR